MIKTRSGWNEQVVRQVFNDDIANKILHTPLISQVDEDNIIWKAESHGRYSVRSAYGYVYQNLLTPLITGTRGIGLVFGI